VNKRPILLITLLLNSPILAENSISDKELLNKINGVWSSTYNSENYSSYSETLYRKNGTLLTRGEVCINSKCESITLTATYGIKGNNLIFTVVSDSLKDFPVGFMITDKIISIDKNTLTLITIKPVGSGNKFIRKKVLNPKYFNNE